MTVVPAGIAVGLWMLALPHIASAQNLFNTTYFDVTQEPFYNSVHLVNSDSTQTLCANVYVFDATEQMIQCGSCPITHDGYLEVKVGTDNTTGIVWANQAENADHSFHDTGLLEIVSSTVGPACSATSAYTPAPNIRGWINHEPEEFDSLPATTTTSFVTGEDEVSFLSVASGSDPNRGGLSPVTLAFLQKRCAAIQESGLGTIFCPTETIEFFPAL